jgi:hypothetical protein
MGVGYSSGLDAPGSGSSGKGTYCKCKLFAKQPLKTEGCITNILAAALKPMYHIEFRQAQQ